MSEDLNQDELATLKARADRMGISYHPSIGLEKMREKLAAAQAGEQPPADPDVAQPPAPAAEPAVETLAQARKRKKNHATELVRIRLTCMNPLKKEWEGEIISVGNNLVGTLKKYIPFNADEGWHLPRMMYEQLLSRQCQTFYTAKSKNGVDVRKGKLIREFAIELLPPLTTDELHDLAQRQAMAKSVD